MTTGSDPSPKPLVTALTFVENFYRTDIADLARSASQISRSLSTLDAFRELRISEFFELRDLQYPPADPSSSIGLPDKNPETLRVALTGRDISGHSKIRTDLANSENMVKATLCYAHEAVLRDPFDIQYRLTLDPTIRRPYWAPLGTPGTSNSADDSSWSIVDPRWFSMNLERLAALKPLIETGIVYLVPTYGWGNNDAALNDGFYLGDVLEGNPDILDLVYGDQFNEEFLVADDLWSTIRRSNGQVNPFFSSQDEESMFGLILELLNSPYITDQEVIRTARLVDLTLPSVQQLKLSDVIRIREDDSFTRFRSRTRNALGQLDEEPTDQSRRLFREDMAAASSELEVATHRTCLQKIVLPKIATWGIGTAIIGHMAGWLPATGGLAAGALVEAALTGSRKGKKALTAHYVTLAGKIQESPRR